MQDGLWTVHNADFIKDPKFESAYARAAQAESDYKVHWRTHIITWAAANAIKGSGDFVECGVNKGFMSSAAMTFVDWNKTHGRRRFFLLDTFCGLVPDLLSDEEKSLGRIEMSQDYYGEYFETAKQNLAEFEDAILIRGAVPGTLPQVDSERISYLHIDMNCAAPEVAAMRYFWPKIERGGVVILDDYAYHGFQPQKDAMDALGKELGFMVASLPTGQGLIVKSG